MIFLCNSNGSHSKKGKRIAFVVFYLLIFYLIPKIYIKLYGWESWYRWFRFLHLFVYFCYYCYYYHYYFYLLFMLFLCLFYIMFYICFICFMYNFLCCCFFTLRIYCTLLMILYCIDD